jgi:mRNA interferase MazF
MNRGDVVLFDFPFTDRTGSKLRPAVVVQADFLNRTIDDTVLALVTRTRRGNSTEVPIEPADAGIRHASIIDCKNLLTADKSFVHAVLGRLPNAIIEKVDRALVISLGLE